MAPDPTPTPDPARPVLALRRATVAYEREPVVEGVDGEVRAGQSVALIGPNGAGKSTLIRAVLGLVPLTSGTIQVLGRSPQAARRQVAYVPQADTLDAEFPVSALQVVLMGRYPRVGWVRRPGAADRRVAGRALVEVLVLGALAGAVGVLVVLRRLAFVGDALTHTVFPGVVIAHLLGRSLLLGALAFGVLTAVLLTGLGSHRRIGDDAALAILLTSFFSLGVVLISRTRGFTADLTAFLFGRVLAVDRTDLLQTLAVAAVAAIVLALLHKELVLRAFDPEATAAMGYRTRALDLVLNLLIALVVVAAVEAVGTVLVIALIVVPAAAARLLADNVAAITALACLLGATGGWLGLAVSYEVSVDHDIRLAAGATIVVVLVGLFLLAAAVAPLRRRRAAAGGHP